MRKTTTLITVALLLSFLAPTGYADSIPAPANSVEAGSAIITPGHAFSVKIPDKWVLAKSADVETPALTPRKYKYPDSPVTIVIYSASKEIEKVTDYKEFIAREEREAEKSSCTHRVSKPSKPIKVSDGRKIPTHMFVGEKYRYLDAYVEHADSIIVISLMAETQKELEAAMPSFNEVIRSYIRLPELE